VISVYRERALLVFPKDWDLESLEKRREHPIGRTENTEETYECNAMKWFCLRACSGTSRSTVSGGIPESSCGLKLNSGGSGRPFGRRAFGSLSSSKKGWIQASTYQKIIRHTYNGLASDADPKKNMEVEYVTKSEKSYE
jgi:hypothetical protein